jgi:two-component system, LytTR family, sensor kinase
MLEKYGYLSIAIKQTVYYTSLITIFYVNFSYLIPRVLAKRKYTFYIIGLVLILPLRVGLQYIDATFLDWYFEAERFFIDDLSEGWPATVFTTIFFIIISTGAKFSRDWFKNRQRIEQLEREHSDAELSLLQYQMSPHFLFNTLNNIYSLVQRKAPEASEAVLKFSDIMRYAVNDTIIEKVDLKREIDYLRSFIDLQKMRLENPGIVNVEIQGADDGIRISPMLFIPFVENAFKHGDTRSENALIAITMTVNNPTVHFSVRNLISDTKTDDTGGIGIKNVSRRLELLYPGAHELDIRKLENEFVVELKVTCS